MVERFPARGIVCSRPRRERRHRQTFMTRAASDERASILDENTKNTADNNITTTTNGNDNKSKSKQKKRHEQRSQEHRTITQSLSLTIRIGVWTPGLSPPEYTKPLPLEGFLLLGFFFATPNPLFMKSAPPASVG